MKCFYHKSDLDGKCSAAIVHYFEPKAELIPIDYNEPFPWDIVGEMETIYMVDFSLQPFEDMLKLNNHCNLIWIDHHITAIKSHKESKILFTGIQRVGSGACQLVWEYFKSDSVPLAIKLLAEYDVWNHEDPRTLPFQYGMINRDNNPESLIWKALFDAEHSDLHFRGILSDGVVILEYQTKQNKIQAKSACFETVFQGLTLLAANVGYTNSKFFDSVWDEEKYDAMCTFHWRKNQWNISLYATKETIDVGKLAKKFGGGGHKHAAGFSYKTLPFSPALGTLGDTAK